MRKPPCIRGASLAVLLAASLSGQAGAEPPKFKMSTEIPL